MRGFSKLLHFICGICGDKLDYKEIPEHKQMTGHDAANPVYTALKV